MPNKLLARWLKMAFTTQADACPGPCCMCVTACMLCPVMCAGTPSIDQPQYGAVQIMKELVPRLIGTQGSTLTEIEEGCGASLIVDDGGTINVYAPTQVGPSLCFCG